MGSEDPVPARQFIETGTEPEYFVTKIRTEDAGGGNVRVMCYNLRHNKDYVLLFTAICPSDALITMGKQAMQAGAEAHNLAMWGELKTEH